MPSLSVSPNCSPAYVERPDRLLVYAWASLSLLVVCAVFANAPGPRRFFMLLSLLFAVVAGLRDRSLLRRYGKYFFPWIAIVLLSALWSPLPKTTLVDALWQVVAPLSACLLATFLAARPHAARHMERLFTVLAMAAAICTLGALHHHVGLWKDMPTLIAATYPGRGVASTFGVLLSLLGLAFLSQERTTGRPIAMILLLTGILLGLLGNNRMYWYAVLAGAPFLLARMSSRRRLWLIFLSAGTAAGILYTSHYARSPEASKSAPLDISTTYVNDPRWSIWGEWISIGLDRPLVGYGYGSRVLPRIGHHITIDSSANQHAHNVLINVFVQTGLAGLLAFAWMCFGAVIMFFRGAGSQRTGACGTWCFVGLSILMGAFVKSMTDDFFWGPAGILMWVLVGLFSGTALHAAGMSQEGAA